MIAHIFLFICAVLCLAGIRPQQSENSPPVVKITAPGNNSVHPGKSLITYSISVSDREDGESTFDEIADDKIFLEIEFVEGSPDTREGEKKENSTVEPAGLSHIKKSDCFTCHQFNTRSIGPAFTEMATRYADDKNAKTLLATRIREGSQHIWGKAIMPAHADVPEAEATHIAAWILSAGANTNLNYIKGRTGAFRTTVPIGAREGYFVLKATYADSGLPGQPGKSLTGQDVVIIRSN